MRGKACLASLVAALLSGFPPCGCAPEEKSREKVTVAVDCEIDAGPCVGTDGDLRVSLSAAPRPVRTMAEVTFQVEAELRGRPISDEAVAVDLSMPGMVMGSNRIILGRVGDGLYEGSGVIVRCPSGGRDWRATVFSPSMRHMEFDFEVDRER